MLPSEMVIMMATAVNKKGSKQILARPMDITGEYIGYLYDSLVTRGYLKKRGDRDYQLTPAGKEAVAGFLKRNSHRTGDFMKRLELLGIDTAKATGAPGKGATGVT
jgi:predicted transcriptional regulator